MKNTLYSYTKVISKPFITQCIKVYANKNIKGIISENIYDIGILVYQESGNFSSKYFVAKDEVYHQ